jgi:aspartate/tyrosine/aromatic aminotransferase
MADAIVGDRLFDRLKPQAPDALLALIGMFKADSREDKIDVGVGVYRDAAGNTPILRSVKAAENILVQSQQTKSYLGSEGDATFVRLIREVLFGEELAADDRIVGVQTPGGCGALRLGAELIRRSGGGARIFVGQPTWPNHAPLIGVAGVPMVDHPYYDRGARKLLFSEMMNALQSARPGDLLLLHGCCHNPTGADLSLDQWAELSDLVVERGLTPFIDIAYQGLGNGLEADAAGTRMMVERVDQALIAQSCDKNFGIYRERTGSLFVKAPDVETARTVCGNLLSLARTNWSMPPDHGAAVVRTVLERPDLRTDWNRELEEMLSRIRSLRAKLAAADPRLAYIGEQNGMFSMLPLSPEAVTQLREESGIYMAGSGRFNVAGLSDGNIDRFAEKVVEKIDG